MPPPPAGAAPAPPPAAYQNGTAHHKVYCYPQAYAAAIAYQQVREQKKVMVLDLGGFTLDYLRIHGGRPDFAVCDSMEYGIIPLYMVGSVPCITGVGDAWCT